MFRQEKDHIPFSERQHFDINTIGFALNLRKEVEDAREKPTMRERLIEVKRQAAQRREKAAAMKVKSLTDNNINKGNGETDEAAPSPTAPRRDKFEPKESNCTVSKCLKVQEEFKEEYVNRQELLYSIEEALVQLALVEEGFRPVSERYEAIQKVQDELHLKLVDANENAQKLWSVFLEKKDTRRELEHKVSKLKTEKAELVKARETDKERVERERMKSLATESFYPDIVFDHQKKDSMKHNGVLNIDNTGHQRWSCCLAAPELSAGCIDDHSVGIREQLDVTRNYFSNQIAVEHRLQHGSTLFRETNRELENGLGYLSKRSMWATQEEIHAQQHGTPNNKLFSMYKSKKVLEHVPPHFHSVRTTGLGFGSSTLRHIVQNNHDHKRHHHRQHLKNAIDASKRGKRGQHGKHHHNHQHHQQHHHHGHHHHQNHVKHFMHSISHKVSQNKQIEYLKEHYQHTHPSAASGALVKSRPATAGGNTREQSRRDEAMGGVVKDFSAGNQRLESYDSLDSQSNEGVHDQQGQPSFMTNYHPEQRQQQQPQRRISIQRPQSASTAIAGGKAFSQSHISTGSNFNFNMHNSTDKKVNSNNNYNNSSSKVKGPSVFDIRRPSTHEIRFVSGGRSAVGKVRAAPEREFLCGNRPLTAPDGYGVYDPSQSYV